MTIESVRFVLMRPRNPENLGAAARAMKNFGIAQWAIVDPRTLDFGAARRVAVHAEELLDRPRLTSSLGEAVGDCVWVVGTSSRRLRGKRRLEPAALAREASERSRAGTLAIVFGDERSGLTNEEIERCHDLSFIPTNPEQPSLNLAQAIAIYGHELRQALVASPAQAPAPLAAVDAELALVQDALAGLLTRGGFLVDEGRSALAELTATLRRAKLTRREAKLWLAALKHVARALPERTLRPPST